MRIVYKFCSRSRPTKFFAALNNIFSLARTDDWSIVATLDFDDTSMYNEQVIETISNYGGKVIPDWGASLNKVHAINRGLDRIPAFDVLVCMSDDMVYIKEGFDEQIISDMLMYFPDTDGFLHYPDGAQIHTSTLNIVGREYFNRQGYIYHPNFSSVYCDNLETDMAKHRGKYKFIDKNIVEHRHPAWKKAMFDEQYRKNESAAVYAKDREVYNALKIEFGL